MQSQSDPHIWYILSLFNECCKCNDYSLTCKHMWALKMIVDEEIPYFFNLLLSIYELNGFMHPWDANKSCKDLNDKSN